MNLLGEIGLVKTIGIAGHVRPDGDCAGSCLAMYRYLKNVMSEDTVIDLYLEEIPQKLQISEDVLQVKQRNETNTQYEVFISLDCGSIDRLGFSQNYFNTAKKTINIDHHISNTNFGDINYVIADSSSTCEILFDLFQEDKIDIEIAKPLYMGIIHDTGVFKHQNTTKKTMETAGKLIAKGIPFSDMIDETFYRKNYHQNQILGRCLLESMLMLEGKCIVSFISQKMLEFYESVSADLDGVIDQLRITQGVEVALLIYECDMREYKVSMRSNGIVDVRKIAVYFGGGGHAMAAGCTMHGTFHDVINNLAPHIDHQLKNIE
ncbi:MAG: phosphoesterase RecJ domain protein [Anaerocolumna sp.]|jgi:phosphoesterase RecJ-like protein|nr:phosphoesterase RecJ domain protein [Anaerocolumna sp.]